MPLDIHLVAHTHWDREWYHTADIFRQRLVDLIDELIEHPPHGDESFLLDGQAIVLEDYLAVRRERRGRLQSLVQSGRVEAGPWYVLADELIPSGEAMVRNLQAGLAVLASLEAKAPPVLYCPDSFGHPAALPEIAAGFGMPLIILWRGYGGQRWPHGDVVRWKSASGAQAMMFHLPPDGYEFGSSLPSDPETARARWEKIRSVLAPRSTVGVTLLQNGADHHARQASRDEAVRLLQDLAEAGGDRVHPGSMRAFADALLQRAAAQRLPSISGELRDSYGYTWTLQGTFGTRAAQKRANAAAERALLRSAEPWSALAWFVGAPSRAHHVRAAWKSLLCAHPHDTLCGTSIDEVASAMDTRLQSALLQSQSIAVGAIGDLLANVAPVKRDVLVVRNDAVHARGGVVLCELIEKLRDEPVGPGSGGGPDFDEIRDKAGKPDLPKGTQLIASRIDRSRVESPRHYPDNDIVRISTVALMIDPVAAMSLTPLENPLGDRPLPKSRVSVSAREMTNGTITCRFDDAVALEHGKRAVDDLIRFEDLADNGDLYTPSPGKAMAPWELSRQRIAHKGPLVGEVTQRWKQRGETGALDVAVRIAADSRLLELGVTGVNEAGNHRLRIGIATGIRKATIVADAAFGSVERHPIAITAAEARTEHAAPTAPLHRYVSLFSTQGGATVYSDGLAEYEVDGEGIVWVTLVRAVGELSRNDLPERPGHAGWPVATPGAQSLGPFEARFGVLLHGARTPAIIDEIEREAERFLTPLTGFTLRAAGEPTATQGPALAGTGLAFSAMKQSEDGEWLVLRCVNLVDREQAGRWTLPHPIKSAKLSRLDEMVVADLPITDPTVIEFTAGPRAVVTILVR